MDNAGRIGWPAGMRGLLKGAVLLAAAVAATAVGAQSAAPTIIEVHAGDTFAGIAFRKRFRDPIAFRESGKVGIGKTHRTLDRDKLVVAVKNVGVVAVRNGNRHGTEPAGRAADYAAVEAR